MALASHSCAMTLTVLIVLVHRCYIERGQLSIIFSVFLYFIILSLFFFFSSLYIFSPLLFFLFFFPPACMTCLPMPCYMYLQSQPASEISFQAIFVELFSFQVLLSSWEGGRCLGFCPWKVIELWDLSSVHELLSLCEFSGSSAAFEWGWLTVIGSETFL